MADPHDPVHGVVRRERGESAVIDVGVGDAHLCCETGDFVRGGGLARRHGASVTGMENQDGFRPNFTFVSRWCDFVSCYHQVASESGSRLCASSSTTYTAI